MRHERELILIGSGNLTLFGQRSSERPLSDGAFPSALKQRPICPMAYNSAARYDRALHARRHQHHQGRRELADQKRRKAYSHPKTAAARAQIDYLTRDSLGARHKRHVF